VASLRGDRVPAGSALGWRFDDCRERVHIVRFCMLGTQTGPRRSPRRATQAA